MTILFGRLGNKTNDIKYFKQYLPLEVKNVIEPFGGTFAVSRIIYNDRKYKKFVNDTDEYLFEIYRNPEKYSEMCNKLNEIAKTCLNENKNVVYDKFMDIVNKDDSIDKNSLFFKYWKVEKIIRGRMIKTLKEVDHRDFIHLMKDITFTNKDYLEIIEEHRKNKNSFIFLDPPYLFSDNSQYSEQYGNEGKDTTEIIYKIYEILKDKTTKCKIMLVINDLKILRWLFKDFIKGDYLKIYQVGKRREKHLIICNY